MSKTFYTASELSRELGLPVSRITQAVESGLILADGRAGFNKNSPLIFDADRLETIRAVLVADRPQIHRMVSPRK